MTLKEAMESYNRHMKTIGRLNALRRMLNNSFVPREIITLYLDYDSFTLMQIAVDRMINEENKRLEEDILSKFDKEDEHEQTDDHREPDERP